MYGERFVPGDLLAQAKPVEPEHQPSQEHDATFGHNIMNEDVTRQTTEHAITLQAEGHYTKQTATILLTGKDAGHELIDPWVVRDYRHDPAETLIGLANLSVGAPKTYEALRDHNIVGFHGTRSITLAGLAKTGKLMSAEKLNKLGPDGPLMMSGEHYAQAENGMEGISFSNLGNVDTPLSQYASHLYKSEKSAEELIAQYKAGIAESEALLASGEAVFQDAMRADIPRRQAAIKILEEQPRSLEAALLRVDFPVMIGINGGFVHQSEAHPEPGAANRSLLHGVGSMGEFRPRVSEIPLSALPVIAVPSEKIEGVQKIFKKFGHEVTVVPIEDVADAFLPKNSIFRAENQRQDVSESVASY